jgi:hypothetical protein
MTVPAVRAENRRDISLEVNDAIRRRGKRGLGVIIAPEPGCDDAQADATTHEKREVDSRNSKYRRMERHPKWHQADGDLPILPRLQATAIGISFLLDEKGFPQRRGLVHR